MMRNAFSVEFATMSARIMYSSYWNRRLKDGESIDEGE